MLMEDEFIILLIVNAFIICIISIFKRTKKLLTIFIVLLYSILFSGLIILMGNKGYAFIFEANYAMVTLGFIVYLILSFIKSKKSSVTSTKANM